MKNREKYSEELLEAIREGKTYKFFDKYVAPEYTVPEHGQTSALGMAAALKLWLDDEYKKPKIDWSKVAVDTPILVRDKEKGKWHKRYFAKFKNGVVSAWYNGATSWSEDGKSSREWRQAKLAEDENGSNE